MATKTFKIGLSATDKQNMAQDIYEQVEALLFSEYNTSSTYNTGDYVVYSGQLYRCLEDNVTGTWDNTKWELATLQMLVDDVNDAVDSVNNKANVDGNYPTLTAGLADNLTPYSEDSGTNQDEPFISQGTGTANNTEIVTVGDYSLLKEKQGNTIVVNQLILDAVNKTYSNITPTAYSGTNGYSDIVSNPYTGNIPVGHKVLLIATISDVPANLDRVNISIGGSNIVLNNSTKSKIQIVQIESNTYKAVRVYTNTLDEFTITLYYKVIDLTQMFCSNDLIPQDLLDNPSHFSWYYNGDLSYNAGTLVNTNGNKLVSTGRNIYNPSETYNVAIPNKQFFVSKTTTITYYDKDKNSIGTESVNAGNTFTTPSNCVFINSSVSDITITPYYTDQEGGEGYLDSNNVPIEYPYEAPYEVNTGSEVLRSAGSVKDSKLPSGEIIRRIGVRTYQAGDENDSSVITDGTNTYYSLETPITEQGTSFSENLPIDDYGMMYWDNTNGVPQGANIFYQVNYKGFVDDMYSRVGGDSSQYVIKSEFTPYDDKDTQLLNAIGGTLRQCLCVKESLDFNNTDIVDMGTLNWNYNSDGFFFATVDGFSGGEKVLCTKYQTISGGYGSLSNNQIAGYGGTTYHRIAVKDTTYGSNYDAFKNAMKGVLLAYEKA